MTVATFQTEHCERRRSHLLGRRVGEADHPGPQTISDPDSQDDGFGIGYECDTDDEHLDPFQHDADMDWLQFLDDNAAEELTADSNDEDGDPPAPTQESSDPPADPLPGFPAGEHLSDLRTETLSTWDLVSKWCKIPTISPKAPSSSKRERNAKAADSQ